jgi:predicted AAA+ superfamily ATPase
MYMHQSKGEDFSLESLAKELSVGERAIAESIDALSDARALTWSVDIDWQLSIELLAEINAGI